MPEVDSLTLHIEVDLRNLRNGLREANQLVSQSSQSMTKSLAGVEASLKKIQGMSATLQSPLSKPERRITTEDRVNGAGIGLSLAGAALFFSGPVSVPVGATVLLAGATVGAFSPDTGAMLSDALSETTQRERLAALESRISQLQSMQGIRTGIEFGNAIREKDLAEQIDRLQLERSELLRQLEKKPAFPETMDLGESGMIGGSGSVETLIGSTEGDILLAIDRIEDLGTAFEGAGTKAIGFAEAQSNAFDTVTQKSEETRNSMRNLDSAARDLGFTFASSFEDAVVEGRNLSDVLQGLERDIPRILTRWLSMLYPGHAMRAAY